MAVSDTLAVFDALASRPTGGAGPQIDVRNGHVVLAFDDATSEATDFFGLLQANYSGGDFLLNLSWVAGSASTGAVRWAATLERHPVGDPTHGTIDIDTDDFGTSVQVSSTPASAPGEISRADIALTASGADTPGTGESFRLRLTREATDAADTMVGDAQLLLVEIREA